MNRKKWIVVFMALALTMMLASCGNSGSSQGQPPTSQTAGNETSQNGQNSTSSLNPTSETSSVSQSQTAPENQNQTTSTGSASVLGPAGGTVTTQDKPLETGMVTLTFDDGLSSVFTIAKDVLAQYDFTGTFFIPCAYVDDDDGLHITWDQAYSLCWDYGWEAGDHTVHHKDLTQMSNADAINEIQQCGTELQNYSLRYQGALDPPFGAFNYDVTMAAVNSGCTSLRQAWIETDWYNTPQNINPWAINVIPIKRDTPLSDIESKIDSAAANHYWIVLIFHDIIDVSDPSQITDPDAITKTKLIQIVQYIHDKGLPVVNLTPGLEKCLYYKTLP